MRNSLLYEKIGEDIRQSIEAGRLNPGDKIPSVNELRQSYGVSHITALRVYKELAEANYVVQKTGKGYFVRERLTRKPLMKGVIGCFLRPLREYCLDDNYFNEINHGMQMECCVSRINLFRSHSLGVLNQYLPSDEGLAEIKRAMLGIAEEVDGYLVDERIPDSVIAEVTNETEKPVVVVNRRSTLEVDAVGPDDRRGMLDALEKLFRIGYDRFIFCNPGTHDSCFAARFEAFKDFVKTNNVTEKHVAFVDNCSINPLDDSLNAIKKAYDKFASDGKTLILGATDSFARDLATAYINWGLKPGKDVGILGFYGLGYATNLKPQLSTVAVDPTGIGALAVKVLMSRISSERYLKPAYYSPEVMFVFGETV
jgi:DNA-binding LacI/PurR family transcriptional regulator